VWLHTILLILKICAYNYNPNYKCIINIFIKMSVLNDFERHQISRTLTADFEGPNYTNTFNYFSDLILYKHTCNCGNCKKISEEIIVKINKIVTDIKLSKLFRFVPLTIKDQSENILANFEQFHTRDITLRDFKMTTEK
jgi:hypothetical protein